MQRGVLEPQIPVSSCVVTSLVSMPSFPLSVVGLCCSFRLFRLAVPTETRLYHSIFATASAMSCLSRFVPFTRMTIPRSSSG